MKHSPTSTGLAAPHRTITADPEFAGLAPENLRPPPAAGLALVDWRKGQYSSPTVDLAHATHVSAIRDVAAAGVPALAEIAGFYQGWPEIHRLSPAAVRQARRERAGGG
ncbi:MAG TPA: hypothetical protein PKY50_08845 [Candidatus Competibacter sp.]|nr:hypothetical protein [Candidatus Competibacter sp.]